MLFSYNNQSPRPYPSLAVLIDEFVVVVGT